MNKHGATTACEKHFENIKRMVEPLQNEVNQDLNNVAIHCGPVGLLAKLVVSGRMMRFLTKANRFFK